MTSPPASHQVQLKVEELASYEPKHAQLAATWLIEHATEASPLVERAVREGRAANPELAMRVLAAIGAPSGVLALEAALQRGNPGESFYAAAALVAHPHPDARAALVRGLANEHLNVRFAVLDALNQREAAWACADLERMAGASEPQIRFRALRAARTAGCITNAQLEQRAAQDPDESLRLQLRSLMNED